MLTIKCSKCKAKLFKYQKFGKGRIIRCWKERIHKDYLIQYLDNEFRCNCGNIVGVDEGISIKMKKSAFIYSGTKE